MIKLIASICLFFVAGNFFNLMVADHHYLRSVITGRFEYWHHTAAEGKLAHEYNPLSLIDILFYVARAQSATGQQYEAKKNLEQIIAIYPYHANSLINLGLCHMYLENYHAAYYYYDRALNLVPKHANLRNKRAVILMKFGQYEKAMSDLREAIKIEPENQRFHHNLGLVYVKLERYKEGAMALKRAIEIGPDNKETEKLYKLAVLLSVNFLNLEEQQ